MMTTEPKLGPPGRTELLRSMDRPGHGACDAVIAELNDMLAEAEDREAALRDAIRASVLLYEDAAATCDFIEVPATEIQALIAALRDEAPGGSESLTRRMHAHALLGDVLDLQAERACHGDIQEAIYRLWRTLDGPSEDQQ